MQVIKPRTLEPQQRALFSGFGLIQLLCVVTLISILTTVAIPSVAEQFASQAVKSSGLGFRYAADFARRIAVKTSKRSVLCAGAPETRCINGLWSDGWTVFSVDMSGGAVALQPIRYFNAPRQNMIITIDKAAFNTRIVFDSRGIPVDGASLPMLVQVCHGGTAAFSLTEVTLTGQSNTFERTSDGVDGGCV